MRAFSVAFGKLTKTPGISCFTPMDSGIISVEARDWAKLYQYRRKQADQIPTPVLEVCGWVGVGGLIPESREHISERLPDRSFRAALSAGLRWDGLLNKAPSITVLTTERLIGFAS